MSVLVSLIIAVAENGIIGSRGSLPWRMSSDLKTFRRITMGKPVIMGRRTFQALGKPLDGRDNIVVTRDPSLAVPPGVTIADSLGDALTIGRTLARTAGTDEVMVIGGGEIYAAALAHAHRIYWTEVHARPEGDVSFPPLDPAEWQEVSAEPLPRGEKDDYPATLRILDRVSG